MVNYYLTSYISNINWSIIRLNMKLKKPTLVLFVIVFLALPVSASLTCDSAYFSGTYEKGDIPQDYFKVSRCNNQDGNLTTITMQGGGASYLTLFDDEIGGNSAKDIKLKITDSNIPVGNYPFGLSFGGSVLVSGIIIIEEPASSTGCRLIELPHTTTYRIKQGDTGMSNQIRIMVSNECPTLRMSVIE